MINIIKSLKKNPSSLKNRFDFFGNKEVSRKIILHNECNDLQTKAMDMVMETIKGKKGERNHFPPATKEWVNSTYSYNKNYTKTLPVADNVVNKLIKGYLNMDRLINNKKSKHGEIRLKRLSLNKITVSKAEVKHTNNKVTVTVYLYNRNKKYYLYKLKSLYLTQTLPLKGMAKRKKQLKLRNPIVEASYLKKKVKFVTLRALKLINKAKKNQSLLKKTLYWDDSNFLYYKNKFYKKFVKDAYEIEQLYMYYVKVLSLNNNKFKNWFILGLKKAVHKLYNKNVEFNFVSLKYLHLNSDIFADSIVTRIRNRENPLLAILNRAIRLAVIPSKVYSLHYKENNNVYPPINKYIHLPFITNNLFYKKTGGLTSNASDLNIYNNDVLHKSLDNLFSQNNQSAHTSLEARKMNIKQVNILAGIKYRSLFGVRLEAAGRLSKRLTAARAVFKLKYKGGLKNIDSSKKRLPSVILRGNTNSNVQYTLINNKTRNGSFGLKGWISGK